MEDNKNQPTSAYHEPVAFPATASYVAEFGVPGWAKPSTAGEMRPFSTYPEDRQKMLALAATIEGKSTLDEDYVKAADELADLVKAIREGSPVSPEDVGKISARLKDGYLKFRSNMIARTETMTSVMSAKHEAYLQALAKAGRDASLVTRTWRSSGRRNVRHTHQILNGQVVRGMDLDFTSPSGAMMRYPGDRSLGAPASEIINCACDEQYDFDFAEAFARSRGR